MKCCRIFAFVLFLVLITSVLVSAQVTTGTPPFASFGGGPFDVVDLANLNVHFSVPIYARAGRGLPFAYALQYDSSIWQPVTSGSTTSWQPVGAASTTWGWRDQSDATTGYVTFGAAYSSFCSAWEYGPFSYYDASGTVHNIAGSITYPAACGDGTSGTFPVSDGSGISLYVKATTSGSAGLTTAIVYSRGGGSITPPLQSPSTAGTYYVTDTNGNQISTTVSGTTTTFADTLSASAVLTIQGNPPTSYTYTPPGGTNVAVSLTYTAYSVQTNFHCANVAEYSGTASLITKITLPDGTYYSITYEPTPETSGKYTGRIASISLPTGGSISYTYNDPNGAGCSLADGTKTGIFKSDGSATGITRVVTPGGNQPAGTWSYKRNTNATQTTVTDPATNQQLYVFSGLYPTQELWYQGSVGGTVLREVVPCYNGNFTNCTSASVSTPITEVDDYIQLQHGSYGWIKSQYNSYGLSTEIDYDDYVPSGHRALNSKDDHCVQGPVWLQQQHRGPATNGHRSGRLRQPALQHQLWIRQQRQPNVRDAHG